MKAETLMKLLRHEKLHIKKQLNPSGFDINKTSIRSG